MSPNTTAAGDRYSTMFAPTLPVVASYARPQLYSNDSEASLNYERGKLGILRLVFHSFLRQEGINSSFSHFHIN